MPSTTPPFEATLTVRVRTGQRRWQFITNTYFEWSRKDVVIDRAAVLDDLVRMRARLTMSGRWFLVGDLNMRTDSDELASWTRALGARRLDSGPVHSHTHLSTKTKSTLDHALACSYNPWKELPLIDDAEVMDVNMLSVSDHGLMKLRLNVDASARFHRIPARYVSKINDLTAKAEAAYLASIERIAPAMIDLIDSTNERSQLALSLSTSSVFKAIDKCLAQHVGDKKIGGFASTDGLSRPWMSDPGVASAIAKSNAAFKTMRQHKGDAGLKQAHKTAQRVARRAQRASLRTYITAQVKELDRLEKDGSPTARRKQERMLRALKHFTPKPTKPLPVVRTTPSAAPAHVNSNLPASAPTLPAGIQPEPLTATEPESAEVFRDYYEVLGAAPSIASDDPKAVMACALRQSTRLISQRLRRCQTVRRFLLLLLLLLLTPQTVAGPASSVMEAATRASSIRSNSLVPDLR